jgi:hypothetical protein
MGNEKHSGLPARGRTAVRMTTVSIVNEPARRLGYICIYIYIADSKRDNNNIDSDSSSCCCQHGLRNNNRSATATAIATAAAIAAAAITAERAGRESHCNTMLQ